MAVDESLYHELYNCGVPFKAALILADPTNGFTVEGGTAVADPAALTSPADVSATYTEAEVQHIRDDVAALRTTLVALLASLRAATVIAT